jgi:transposase
MKGEIIKVERSVELAELLRAETDNGIKIKLIFLHAFGNSNMTYEAACQLCGIHTSTGYVWVRRWNKDGYEGLKESPNQGGRPAILSETDLKRLEEILREKDYWTTKEVRKAIWEKFSADLSDDTIVRLLRHEFGMRFSKPYSIDYRRPVDAEAVLENQLHLVFMLLKERGIREDETSIGFVDETRPQNTPNTVRVWSFNKLRIKKNTSRFKTNTIGFYAIKGTSVQEFLDDSKGKSIAKFFEHVKEANKDSKAIVAVIDNFASHKSSIVRETIEKLDIYLVFLPPYSPDLNPIEFIWKSIKRVLSLQFVADLESMKRLISDQWNTLSCSISYAKGWIRKFLARTDYNILNY